MRKSSKPTRPPWAARKTRGEFDPDRVAATVNKFCALRLYEIGRLAEKLRRLQLQRREFDPDRVVVTVNRFGALKIYEIGTLAEKLQQLKLRMRKENR